MDNYNNSWLNQRQSLMDDPELQQQQEPSGITSGLGEGAGDQMSVAAASGGGPWMAGGMIGASFLSNYLAARARENENRKARQVQIEQNYSNEQNQALNNEEAGYIRALR